MIKEKDIKKILNSQPNLDKKNEFILSLLKRGHITDNEFLLLLSNVTINIFTEKMELSSGGKIVGGSDFTQTTF